MRCTYINIENDIECVMCGILKDIKQWKSSRCSFINDEQYGDINDNNTNNEPKQLYCNQIWNYALIKRILMAKDNEMNDKKNKKINQLHWNFKQKYVNYRNS